MANTLLYWMYPSNSPNKGTKYKYHNFTPNTIPHHTTPPSYIHLLYLLTVPPYIISKPGRHGICLRCGRGGLEGGGRGFCAILFRPWSWDLKIMEGSPDIIFRPRLSVMPGLTRTCTKPPSPSLQPAPAAYVSRCRAFRACIYIWKMWRVRWSS